MLVRRTRRDVDLARALALQRGDSKSHNSSRAISLPAHDGFDVLAAHPHSAPCATNFSTHGYRVPFQRMPRLHSARNHSHILPFGCMPRVPASIGSFGHP